MAYEQISHLVKIGGTVFFFLFLAAVAVYVFWRKNQTSFLGAAWPALAVFFGITASFFLATWLGSYALMITAIVWLIAFVASMRFFKSVDDDRFGDIANLPIGDESLIVDQE
ncbi:MAG: cbb3-type cytochrome c oxidase subunit 3 [Robiginitomaculum sp.]